MAGAQGPQKKLLSRHIKALLTERPTVLLSRHEQQTAEKRWKLFFQDQRPKIYRGMILNHCLGRLTAKSLKGLARAFHSDLRG
jgi:hypothetical protein